MICGKSTLPTYLLKIGPRVLLHLRATLVEEFEVWNPEEARLLKQFDNCLKSAVTEHATRTEVAQLRVFQAVDEAWKRVPTSQKSLTTLHDLFARLAVHFLHPEMFPWWG